MEGNEGTFGFVLLCLRVEWEGLFIGEMGNIYQYFLSKISNVWLWQGIYFYKVTTKLTTPTNSIIHFIDLGIGLISIWALHFGFRVMKWLQDKLGLKGK